LPEDARIVIIRFSSLGDVVKATILPRVLRTRYPRAHLTMVTAEAHLPLIAGNPHLDRAIGFARRQGVRGLWRLACELRQEPVHLVVDVHKSLRSRLLALWLGAPRVPYSKRTWARTLLVRFGLNRYRAPRRKDQDFVAALAAYGVRDDGQGTEIALASVVEDPTRERRFAAPLAAIRRWRAERRPVIGVAPVAAWALKRWPLGHYQALLHTYVRETGGGVLLFGGAADRDILTLAEGLEGHAVPLAGKTSLLESAWFASLCDLVVANDTGMSHLAEAVGCDVIVLFGPTSEELGYFPVRLGSRVIQRDLPCRPCTRMGEGRCTHPLPKACLVTIAPEAVSGALLSRLGHSCGASRPGASC
jgi:ADP-heptose:LPS heptosyltransferase